jgi:hypothetical protein
VVQQLLGHKTIRTTLRYSHVHPTELREAVNRLGQKMMPNGPWHFTITSHSAGCQMSADSAETQNESRLQPDLSANNSEDRCMPQTVNTEGTSSQDHAPGDPPSSA